MLAGESAVHSYQRRRDHQEPGRVRSGRQADQAAERHRQESPQVGPSPNNRTAVDNETRGQDHVRLFVEQRREENVGGLDARIHIDRLAALAPASS